MTGIVLFGLGKIAEVLLDLLRDEGQQVAGFTVDAAHLPGPAAHGLPAVAFEEVQARFPPDRHAMLVAIGYHDLNRLRAARCAAAEAKGYRLASFVSASARVPRGTHLGGNCVVMPGAVLQPRAALGEDVFVWHNAVVGHHAVIGDHGWLASNCTISSATSLGPRCFVGVNAAVGHNLRIGEAAVVGAGAVVTASQPDGAVLIAPPSPRYRLDSERFMRITRMS
jgi:sugar O-acyltransferase (sialic acid O-acetyltransferase NeuD family)